jgi:hypothetical protein
MLATSISTDRRLWEFIQLSKLARPLEEIAVRSLRPRGLRQHRFVDADEREYAQVALVELWAALGLFVDLTQGPEECLRALEAFSDEIEIHLRSASLERLACLSLAQLPMTFAEMYDAVGWFIRMFQDLLRTALR